MITTLLTLKAGISVITSHDDRRQRLQLEETLEKGVGLLCPVVGPIEELIGHYVRLNAGLDGH